jgi:hypothetical protein
MITCKLKDKTYTVDFISGRALREMEPAAKMYSRIVTIANAAAKGEDIPQDESEVQEEPEPVEPVETEEQRAAREDRERREEAKAILTQQILPRAVPVKPAKVQAEPSEGTRKQAVTVHPEANDSIRSAPRKKRKGSLFLDLTESSEDNNEAQIQSAVRQVLDETEGK